jgi:hypothetical protein
MDHLPIPKSYEQYVPLVPYFGVATKYDNAGFEGFPERCGLDSNLLLSGNFDLSSKQRSEWLESFMQEWLFFGLLHEFSKAL